MLALENMGSFLIAATLVIIVPGPATFYVIACAQRSLLSAIAATAGTVFGDFILITLAGLGFAALVAQWPVLLTVIKIAGALYVAYLGIESLRSRAASTNSASGAFNSTDHHRGFVKGLLITISNPKPILFFSAFFPMFIGAKAQSVMPNFYALGILFQCINIVYFAGVTATILRFRKSQGTLTTLPFRTISGTGLLFCSLALLVSSLAQY